MEVSARNSFKGTVKKLVVGEVTAEVILEVAPGVEMVSVITKSSVEQLGLAEGKEAYAVVKSTDVMLAID